MLSGTIQLEAGSMRVTCQTLNTDTQWRKSSRNRDCGRRRQRGVHSRAEGSGQQQRQQQVTSTAYDTSRRHILNGGVGLLGSLAGASAAQMPQMMDQAWQAIGGGPADLFFPDAFLGRWYAESALVNVELPLGPEYVPNMQVVERAKKEDLKKRIRYEVEYIRNGRGKVIIDRRFNTAKLMDVYLGKGAVDLNSISWNPDDPNRLALELPGGLNVLTRVTRRSQEQQHSDRISTSEFFEQVFDTPGRPEPKVKASQCYTKYKWRSEEQAAKTGGPIIVATQVVSDYLTPYDGEALMIRANNRPITIYTYSMSFRRAYGRTGPVSV